MRKVLIAFAFLLLPSALLAQGALQVTSVTGPVEWRAAASTTFVTLTKATPAIQAGDELRTGDGASVILTVPDGSYMVVSENSKMVIEDFWSGSVRSIMNLMMGQVRFYINRLGGRPNPYSVRTPTALIAVRGTVFDVNVDFAQIVQVECFEGQVNVQNVAFPNREVILNPGHKTLVRPGEIPLTPVRLEAELNKDRVIAMRKVNGAETNPNGAPSLGVLSNGNDRGNRPTDPQFGTNSRTIDNTQRAKPTLSFP
jgi:ferric-dicitrate binding protein FerR (iron transport regulator)